jgi:O-methyltransferase
MRANLTFLKELFLKFGFQLSRNNSIIEFPIELSKHERDIVRNIFDMKWTMTSLNNLFATALSCKYILENDMSGDFVECGVYKGGTHYLPQRCSI